jgi:hypothetical protein
MVPWQTFLRSIWQTLLRLMRMDRKPEAVRWYGSAGLFRQLRRIAHLSWEGDVIDARDWMQPNVLVYIKGEFSSQLDSAHWKEGEPDHPEDGAIWFDYVADTGDDWYATHDIAFLLPGDLWVDREQGLTPGASIDILGQRTPDLPGGEFLIFGGDTAYYVPSAHTIRERVVDPFNTAYQERYQDHSQPPPRPLLGIPGNHDWYDSLDGSAGCSARGSVWRRRENSNLGLTAKGQLSSRGMSRCRMPRTSHYACPGNGTFRR